MLARPDVLFLDTETTGLDGQAEIVEIAVIDTEGRPLLNTLVRPDGIIPAEVIRIHGIDATTVRDAPRWPEVYPSLLDLLQRHQIIVYNAAFDFRLVNQMNQRCGFPLLTPAQEREWHCAMRRFASWRAEWNAKYGNYRWHKLDIALAAFGHPPPGHRALGDALACRMVVMGMARGDF